MWGHERHLVWLGCAILGCGAQVFPESTGSGTTGQEDPTGVSSSGADADGSSGGPGSSDGGDASASASTTSGGSTTEIGGSSSGDGGSTGGDDSTGGSSDSGGGEEGSSSSSGGMDCAVAEPSYTETIVDAAGTLRADHAVVADFNADDNLDVATASSQDGDDLAIYLGDGTGALAFHTSVTIPVGVVRIAAGRVDNGDDYPDLITIGGLGDVTVWLNDTTGAFSGTAIDYYPSVDMVTADFDNNGLLDAAIVPNAMEIPMGESKIGVFLADGIDSIALDPTFHTDADFATVVAADFDGDLNQDLLTSYGDLHFGDGTGDFGAAQSVSVGPGGVGLAAAVGDLDGDDDVDVAVVDLNFAAFTITVNELLNDGTGNFAAPVSTSFDGNALSIFDTNNDGRNDIVYPLPNNPFLAAPPAAVIWPRDLCDAWDPAYQVSPLGNQTGSFYPNTLAHGDLNGDGTDELVIPNMDDQSISVLVSG